MDIPISLTVNGKSVTRTVDSRTLLVQFLRETLQLTGTHVGCDTAQCGACTVHMNGRAVKSCSMLAAQVQGSQITTIEGLAKNGELHPMQAAFRECHGLQCGFCSPGMMMTARALLDRTPDPSEHEIREAISGQICRCTGYATIVRSIQWAADHPDGLPATSTADETAHEVLDDAEGTTSDDAQTARPDGGDVAEPQTATAGSTT